MQLSPYQEWTFKGISEVSKQDVEMRETLRSLLNEAARDALPPVAAGEKVAVFGLKRGSERSLNAEEVTTYLNTAIANPDQKAHQLEALEKAAQAFGLKTAAPAPAL